MKKETATYSVVPAGHRVVDDFRGDRITATVWRVIKTPIFGDPTEYEVVLSTIADYCNCPGGLHHGKCKHLAMVYGYIAEPHEEEKDI